MKKIVSGILSAVLILSSALGTTALAENSYASGLNDSASYAFKVPETSATLSNSWVWTNSAVGYSPQGELGYSGGYVNLLHEGGEHFVEFTVKSGLEGNCSFNAAQRLYGLSKGIPSEIDIESATALAIRLKIKTPANDLRISAFDIFINGNRCTNTTTDKVKFLDSKTGVLSDFLPQSGHGDKNGFETAGELDGYMIIPFTTYNNSAVTAAWLRENYTGIGFMLHNSTSCSHGQSSSNWDGKQVYVGDQYFVENIDTFVSARRTAITYASGNNDTGYYALNVPEHKAWLGYSIGDGAYPHIQSSRNNINGEFTNNNNGALHIGTINGGDSAVEINVKTNADASNTIYTGGYVYQDYSKNGLTKGVPTQIDLSKTTAIAIRVAGKGGYDTQMSAFDVYLNGSRTSNAASRNNIKFIDYNTGTVTSSLYNDGLRFTGDFDGWLLIPITAWGNGSTVTADWLRANYNGLSFMMHGKNCSHGSSQSSWVNKKLYVGDALFVENMDTFVSVHSQGHTYTPETNVFTPVSATTEGAEPLGLGMFHFSSHFATNYGTDNASRLNEVEDVLASGYVNTLFLSGTEACFEDMIDLAVEYNCSIWFSAQRFYSDVQTIEAYMANVESAVNKIRAKGAFDLLKGFYWDEPYLNGMTNADFHLMTKTLYEKWGKRNFPVFGFAPLIDEMEFSGDRIEASALEYVTDAAWDNYSYDLRTLAINDLQQRKQLENLCGVGFKTAEEYYRWIHAKLMSKLDHDTNIWFYPGTYATWLYTETRADEGMSSQNISFFEDMLYDHAKPGGLMLYTYFNSTSNANEKGLSYYLDVKSRTTGEQVMHTDAEKWTGLSNQIKALKSKFDTTYTVPAMDVPFGNIDIVEKTQTSISYNADEGMSYSIDGGVTYETDGLFDNLTVNTAYTIRVKETNGTRYKDFEISTLAQNPYASGLNDTASYAVKIPTDLEVLSSDYCSAHERSARNREDTAFMSGGYIHLKDINGERFAEVRNNDGESYVMFKTLATYRDRPASAKGIPAGIDTENLMGMAIRLKISGGEASQMSALDVYVDGSRTSNAASAPLKFIDKATGTISDVTYNSGIRITGEVDGWLIVPFESYPAAKGKSWFIENYSTLQIWQHESACSHGCSQSSWDNKTMYIGDTFFIEDMNTFAAART